jgi:hypothetical protein
MKPDYLSDGVYAQIERGMVKLTTGSHVDTEAQQTIYLEPEVCAALQRYLARWRLECEGQAGLRPAKLVKLSVCACGFPLFKEHIRVGDVYAVNPDKKEMATLICGGCRSRIPLLCIWANAPHGGEPGYLPEQVFEYEH